MVPDGLIHVQSLPKTMLDEDLIQCIHRHPPRELKRLPKKVAPSNDETCEHLAVLLAAVAQNILPETLQYQLMAARMIHLPKAPGKFRPIHIANALRRIASKMLNKIIMPEVSPVREEHQYALGRAVGGEALQLRH
eukprot:4772902-Amphidinium_carterae.2